MNSKKSTLAIYGTQDHEEYEHPLYVHDHNLTLMQNGKVNGFCSRSVFRGENATTRFISEF